ncbi:P-loop containing nucleoside triphosphate hydrolase protein [Kalaharituber pfeilii]|nr:P-loop containing nucleoside triphosphate hydrolase protein [Kalaharituber pfeilii]
MLPQCYFLSRHLSTTPSAHHENPLRIPKGPAPQLPRMQRGLPPKRRIPGVDKVLLVSSAKGGVGKSTVAVNIAVGAALGMHVRQLVGDGPGGGEGVGGGMPEQWSRALRVGILDVDVFGPSVPLLMGLEHVAAMGSGQGGEQEGERGGDTGGVEVREGRLVPVINYGVKSMSMGYLIPGDRAPVAWRGLMVMKGVQQLLWEVDWGELDLLVVDLPPGTGDVQLTVTQQVEVDGAVVVTTPQDLAIADAWRGIGMWEKMGVGIMGVVVNMAWWGCKGCGRREEVFGKGGTERVRRKCTELGVEVLGEIPVDGEVGEEGPVVVKGGKEGGEAKRVFGEIVERVVGRLWGVRRVGS